MRLTKTLIEIRNGGGVKDTHSYARRKFAQAIMPLRGGGDSGVSVRDSAV